MPSPIWESNARKTILTKFSFADLKMIELRCGIYPINNFQRLFQFYISLSKISAEMLTSYVRSCDDDDDDDYNRLQF